MGPRTEQFALGSLYYLINYGFEVYGDRCLTDDPNDHGPRVVDLLQNMDFPKLDGDPLIDDIIKGCWHNQYITIASLAADTKTLLSKAASNEGTIVDTAYTRWYRIFRRLFFGEWSLLWDWLAWVPRVMGSSAMEPTVLNRSSHAGQDHAIRGFSSEQAFCQDLSKRGLLDLLSSATPEQLGFTFEWYRHSQ